MSEPETYDDLDLRLAEAYDDVMRVPRVLRMMDPNRFWVAPAKSSLPANARISAELKSQISQIVATGITAFRTESDFIRAAIWWFMNQIIGPGMDRKSGMFDRKYKRRAEQLAAAQQLEAARRGKAYVGGMVEPILALWELGDEDHALDHFNVLWREVDLEDEPVRTRMYRELWRYEQLESLRNRYLRERGIDTARIPEPRKIDEPGHGTMLVLVLKSGKKVVVTAEEHAAIERGEAYLGADGKVHTYPNPWSEGEEEGEVEHAS